MQWLLLSDLIPLFGFMAFGMYQPSFPALAAVATRICSLAFHITAEQSPYMLNLDYIGITAMCAASLSTSRAVSMPWHSEYAAVLCSLTAALQGAFLIGLYMRSVNRNAGRAIVGLAALGHIPTAYAIITMHACAPALIASAALLAVGFFLVEPMHHTLWHWMAAAAQGLLLPK